MTASKEKDAYKAIIYADPGTLKTDVIELPIPQPGPGQILVRLFFSGVCHTDIGFCLNKFANLPLPTPKGQVGGHEGIGKVVSHGPGVEGPPMGSHVGIKYAADACLACDHCLEGGESSCRYAKVSGYLTPGTFQQYCLVPARYVTSIPDTLDLAMAAPLMCGGITVYTALKTAGLRHGDWVIITGAGGGLGHLAIQYVKALGGKALGIDTGAKAKFCLGLGAEEFFDFTQFKSDEVLAEQIVERTNGGARIALMCASSSKSYSQVMDWLGFRGTAVCLGIPDREGCLVPNVTTMVSKEQRIIAIKTGNRMDAKECLDLAVGEGIRTHYKLRKMTSLSNVFEEMEAGKIQGRVVLDLR